MFISGKINWIIKKSFTAAKPTNIQALYPTVTIEGDGNFESFITEVYFCLRAV